MAKLIKDGVTAAERRIINEKWLNCITA